MTPAGLADRPCKPCTKRTPKVSDDAARALLTELDDWTILEGRLGKQFVFKDFRGAMAFLNALAKVAEEAQHHPDFSVHYNEVTVVLWTHAIDGLSENDFIVAARLDALPRP